MSEASQLQKESIQLEKDAFIAYEKWREFMDGALIKYHGSDRDAFGAGYAAGKTVGMSNALDLIKKSIEEWEKKHAPKRR